MEMEAECVSVVLKPKFELLDPNFEGYKLNLGKIPTYSKNIDQGVLQAPESDNYSYQQVRLYALHNHLLEDPWCTGLNLYFAASGAVHVAALDESPGAPCRLRDTAVLQLPSGGAADAAGAPTHPSLCLASERLALVADGRGALYVAQTGDRRQHQLWQVAARLEPLAGAGFVLAHCALDPAGRLHALTEHVVEKETVPEWRPDGGAEATFLNLLTWLTLETDADCGWRVTRLRQAATAGTVHYSCLEQSGGALCVAADRPAALVRDSQRPAAPTAAAADTGAGDGAGNQTEPQEPLYRWSQTADDVTVQLTSPVGCADGVRVVLEPSELSVSAGQRTVLRGALPAAIRRDESTWTVDDGRLELVLAKVERGQRWAELLVGDTRGQQTADADTAGDDAMDTTERKPEADPDRPGPVVLCDDPPGLYVSQEADPDRPGPVVLREADPDRPGLVVPTVCDDPPRLYVSQEADPDRPGPVVPTVCDDPPRLYVSQEADPDRSQTRTGGTACDDPPGLYVSQEADPDRWY
ncbi:NudC domain-containing protein 1 [Amphibalanus amphitrite]|uniref:NudC domain-containing protein 1 n=1 Tax=Amphibalanus amphitrite TaxID=1232801 RepID=A0A6A4VDR1_AMPAM|nr:NudC domain-containing protein 1 [Amphibalanus amphitrite]KAF0292025.1 NudC domain-containing protein 1 [Amphibalanus amphitrite]KAF0292026.1 NudC domain-containing protein 1 [Amphibalanus amphitrite]